MAQATIATTVTGLQGHPVSNTAPATVGQLLTWNGTAWAPDNTTYMPVAGGTFTGPVTLAGAATEANQPATLTQVATAAGVNIGRNFVHNPMFTINQRGSAAYAGTVGTTSYTLDRWIQNLGATGDTNTVTVAAASDADRAAIGDETATQYPSCALAGGTGATNSILFAQRIESVNRLSNKTCTLSFWAYSPTSLRVGLSFQQNFGSGGSPSASVNGNIGVAALTTGWARYSYTFTWPSAAGQAFGTTGGTDFSTIFFWLSCPPANTTNYPTSGNLGAQTGTINIWGVQLEIGSQATPFEHRDPEIELGLCLRFYQFLRAMQVGGWALQAGSFTTQAIVFKEMRAAPTAVTSNISYGSANSLSVNVQAPAAGAFANIATTILTATGQNNTFANFNVSFSADL